MGAYLRIGFVAEARMETCAQRAYSGFQLGKTFRVFVL